MDPKAIKDLDDLIDQAKSEISEEDKDNEQLMLEILYLVLTSKEFAQMIHRN